MPLFEEKFVVEERLTGKRYRVVCNDYELTKEGQFAQTVATESGEDIIVATSAICDAYIRKNKLAYVIIYHELGHIYYGHNHINGDTRKERMNALQNNRLYIREAQADDYAAHFLGKSQVIEGLHMLSNALKKDSLEWKEIQLRIAVLQNWK